MNDTPLHDTEDREDESVETGDQVIFRNGQDLARSHLRIESLEADLAAARQEIALREDDYNSLHKEYTIEVETLRQEIAKLKAELAKRPRWVSVEERLPELLENKMFYKITLVRLSSGRRVAARFDNSGVWAGEATGVNPTHWLDDPEGGDE